MLNMVATWRINAIVHAMAIWIKVTQEGKTKNNDSPAASPWLTGILLRRHSLSSSILPEIELSKVVIITMIGK